MPALTPADWERAALQVIAEGGLAAVSLGVLCSRLGVTKGSFYWHFESRDDLIARAIARWEADNSELRLPDEEDPRELLVHLAEVAVEFAGKQSIHARLALETADPRVAAAMARVTSARLRLLAGLYRRAGLSPAAARAQAMVAYAAVLGLQQLGREDALPARGRAALVRVFRSTLVPPDGDAAAPRR